MRRTLQVLALLCLALTLVSFEIGRRAERELRTAVAGLSGPLPFELVVERYERGVFRSRAETVLRDRWPEPGEPALRLRLHHEIAHGPYPAAYVRSRDFDVIGAHYPHLLSRHSILNLQTVLTHAVWNSPQTWTGTFQDHTDPANRMQSRVPPAGADVAWADRLAAYLQQERSA